MAKKKIEKINSIVTLDNNGNIVRQNLTGNTGGYTANTTPALVKVSETVKPTKSILDKDIYLAKNAGAGVLRAGTNAVDSVLQETQNNLQKGAKRDQDWYNKNALGTILGILAPTGSLLAKQTAKQFDKEYQKKSWTEKFLDNLNDIKESAINPALKEAVRTLGTLDKQALGGKINKGVQDLSKTINKPSEDLQKDLAKERDDYSKLINFSGDVMQQVGYMAPSIATTALTKDPNLGLAAMGISAKGGSTKEALEKGADLDTAINIGNAKALVEVGTEKLTGGLNFFGKGALDNIALKGVDKAIRNKGLNFLAKQGLAIVGEQGEEVLADILGTLIDKGTIDPNAKYTKEDLMNTLSQTAASTVLLNALGGGYTPAAYRQNALEMQNTNNTQNKGNTGVNTQNNINTQVNQENAVNGVIQSEKTAIEKVNDLNEAERQALTEITMKRKSGMPLDQNDIATINYLNNKDNDLSLADAMTKAENDLEQGNVNYVNELMNNLDDVQIEGLEGLKTNQNINQNIQENINTIPQTTLQDSATEYGFKGDSQELANIDNSLQKRGITARFDSSLFDNNNTNAIWINENGQRQVIFNPNANENTIVEEIATHELTHDLMSSENSKNTLKAQKILDYVKTLEGYQEARQNLEQAYSQMYDVNSQEFQNLIDEETVADVLGKKLGNQEFVNQITNSNPSLARRIYNWVIDKLDSIVNSGGKVRNEKLFWQNVKNNFEKAYRMESQSNSESNIKSNINTTKDNQELDNSSFSVVENYINEKGFELKNNGNLIVNNLTNKQINDLVKLYKTTGYDDVSSEYLKERLQQGNIPIMREVADRFIEKELGYKPKYDTTKIFEDSDGNKLTKEQVEFFKDSDVRDIRGRLIPVYHRTNSDFTVFDNKAGKQHGNKYGKGFYFSITPENYGNNTMTVYLNAKEGEYKYIPSKGYYVVQEPNQIKNVDNKNPTSNPDIRYSVDTKTGKLKDSSGKNVKLDTSKVGNTGSLMAIHNLNEAKLRGILELGGFPVPSIAVTNPNVVNHQNYGDISVLFDKNTIDPSNKLNEVYDRDVWSPTFPNIEYEVFDNKIDDVAKKLGMESWELRDDVTRTNSNPESLIKMLSERENIKQKIENGLDINKEVSELYGEKGIENDKELFTPSGNRRSFWQLHEKYNLDNIVKALTKGDTKGTQKFFPGYGQIQSKMAKQFNSIEDIKSNESLIQNLGERKQALIDAREQIENDIDQIVAANDNTDYSTVSLLLADFADGNLTAKRFKNLTDNYYQTTQNVPDSLINKIIEDLNKLKNLPTDYFEAKPQRAVGLDEVQAIVIPNNMDSSFKKQLQDQGLTYYEYDPSIDGDRNRVINQFDDLKFSKQSQTWNDFLDKNIKSEGTKTKLKDLKTTGQEGELYWKDQGADDKVAKILSEVPKEKANLKDTTNEVAGSLYRNIVSKGGEIEKIAFKTNKPNVNYTYDKMLRSMAEAQQHIGTAQADMNYNKYTNFTDANGNKVSMSLNDIRNDAKNSGISEQTLNEYLAHKLNEYRYKEGKPVFSKNITSEMSTETCNEIEKQHPEIKRIAENVWQFEQNQLKNLYDSGLISEARYNELSKNKHYVRIQRQMPTNRGTKITADKNGRVQVNQPIQEAKGGNQDIMPIMEGIAKYTTDLVKMERTNESMRELGKALGMGSTNENINAFTDEESFGINPDLIKDNGDGTYTMTYFDKGVPTVVPINKGIYDAYVRNKAVSLIEGSKAFKTLSYAPRKISQVFRSLTTNNNPLFMATNFFKDIGDAPFNSKYTKEFAKTYLSTEALRQVAGNGEYNQLYNAAGGNSDSYFVDGNFTDKTTSKVKKGIEKLWSPVQKGNEIVESVPRVAEFIATIKANGYEVNANGELVAQKGIKPTKTANEVMNEALYNAAEITTNFKRGGDVAKSLNRNGATFLNASIQGFDKQIRNFKDALTSGDKKQIVHLLTKALIFGIAPTMLNDAANGDDDEYKEMQEYQKDNYYLFKAGNGKWIRIPKGRAMSVLGSAARRTKNFLSGDKNAYAGFVDFAKNQVAPNSIFENNILAPFSQVKNNKAWSGNKIIPDSIAKRPTEEQYNEKTDAFSKWLGQVFKDIPVPKEYENFKSPMAINYLIDQYTGAIGDVALPMMAEKATSDQSPLIAPITSKFTTDSVYSNKSISDFYDAKTEIEKKKNSVKATGMDTAKNSYMTSKNMQISNLYKEQREIQSNSSLSKKEKYKQAREVQKEINELAKDTVKDINNAKKEEYYIKIGDYYYKKVWQNGKDTYVRDTSKKIPTEKYALYDYFKEKYNKSKESD